MASIRKRAGKWQAQVRRSGHPPISQTFNFKTDAQTWARQMEANADRRSIPIDPKALDRFTLADLLQRYRDTVTVQKRGQAIENIRLNVFLRSGLAVHKLSALSPSLFTAYRDNRLKVVGPGTVLRELSLLQSVFEVARKEWCIPLLENPVKAIRKPRAPQARDRRLQDGEWDTLMQGCAKCRNKLIEPLIRIAVETGMRRGEMLNMKWSDLDPVNRTLHIPVTKNGHSRTIPLTSVALEVMEVLKGAMVGEDRIIPLTIPSVKLAWRRLVDRTGLEDLHFHDLRHEAISRFFEMGLSIPEVALISGHRDARMLFRYTHLRPEDVGRKLLDVKMN